MPLGGIYGGEIDDDRGLALWRANLRGSSGI
jgi:hypothetical protein